MKRFFNNGEADLRFLESTDENGFTSTNIMNFRERSPAAIVRELVQNSLDATQPEEKTVVRFVSSRIDTRDVPGIDSYRRAFRKAVDYRRKASDGRLSDQEKMVVESISKALGRREQNVLAVLDNGHGLNRTTMRALLSDGVSTKTGSASGAFGNGHFTVFPTSDLRYVLYGAIHDNGADRRREWVASGHAILASHSEDRRDRIGRSANGFYIADNKGREHIYPTRNRIPPLIRGYLEEIDRRSGSGTAVVVPAFNHFGDRKEDLYVAVKKAAACNFFVAIHGGRLEIAIDDRIGDASLTIDKENLEVILGEFESEKRGGKDFLSGSKASSAYQCLRHGESFRVEVPGGVVQVVLHQRSGRTRVHLCRNGMWITNNDPPSGGIPAFYAAFEDHEPFEALVLVRAADSGRFHELVRKAEGPMHNRLDISQMSDDERRELRKAFKAIKSWIKERVPKISHDSYSPDDFLNFTDGSGNRSGGKNSPLGYKGSLRPARRTSRRAGFSEGESRESTRTGAIEEDAKSRPCKSRTKPSPSIRNAFRVTAVPKGEGRMRLTVRAMKEGKNLGLYLVLDENEDVTTDNIWKDRGAIITEASIDGRRIPSRSILGGDVPGIELGDMGENTSASIDLKYRVEVEGRPVPDPAFRIVIKQQPPLEQDRDASE